MNRPKLIRSLRIAWSVAWGLLAVLLCVLWVRSYWWREQFVRIRSSDQRFVSVGWDYGTVFFLNGNAMPDHLQMFRSDKWHFSHRKTNRSVSGFEKVTKFGDQGIYLPNWFVILLCAVLSA